MTTGQKPKKSKEVYFKLEHAMKMKKKTHLNIVLLTKCLSKMIWNSNSQQEEEWLNKTLNQNGLNGKYLNQKENGKKMTDIKVNGSFQKTRNQNGLLIMMDGIKLMDLKRLNWMKMRHCIVVCLMTGSWRIRMEKVIKLQRIMFVWSRMMRLSGKVRLNVMMI